MNVAPAIDPPGDTSNESESPAKPSHRRRRRGSAGAIDAHVGARLRLQRTLRGLSQEKLGEALGLTFQQIQKYERGSNRIGAGRLYEISRVLDVPIGYFFESLDSVSSERAAPGVSDSVSPAEYGVMNRRETLELVRGYYRIADPKVRRRILELVKSVAPPAERSND